jgi:DNA-binding CsgD family transcriptional regulator
MRHLLVSIQEAHAALPREVAEKAWQRGLKLSEREAALVALGGTDKPSASVSPRDTAGRPAGRLTSREREIAALVAAGMSNKQIAVKLKIAGRTADAHIEHIRTKLGVHSRAQIASWATENRMLAAATP